MEAKPLKLGAEHVPFPCSLREMVLDRYGEPPGVGSNAHPMQNDELMEYLKSVDNFSLSPWVAIMSQAEAIGDPATPSRDHTAILRWLGKALEMWEKQFPLDGRIAAQVRRLKPLSAALALTDPTFMRPGAHPIHQLLDNIQARAIGWQSRLDRVGTILEQQVTATVEESREWFTNSKTDLTAISANFSAAAERDQARAKRMVQRVVETETGKVRTAAAKQEAARMINAALEKYPAPAEIGDFIKGPWYTSAQLLLLKMGADSEQWQSMSTTTETLLDSLQSLEDATEERRQYIFEAVTHLPKEMRRWLLSLHHDTDAVNEAMGIVEFAHLRILRRQTLELHKISPIVIDIEYVLSDESQSTETLKNWQEGQWFSMDMGADGVIRVQLVLKIDQSQQLLFTNLAGIKVLQLSFAEFNQLRGQNKATALYSGASFSLCLAAAVGIESVEILDALASALLELEPSVEARPEPTSVAKPEADFEAKPEPEPKPELEPGAEAEREPEFEGSSELTFELSEDAEPEFEPDHEVATNFNHSPSLKESPLPNSESKPSSGFLTEQAEEIKARGGYFVQNSEDIKPQEPSFSEPAEEEQTDQGYLAEQANDEAATADDRADQKDLHDQLLNLPMGIWVGFHDGETPLMARLAVHDPDGDYYVFVNRKGVKMRQLNKQEMLNLIEADLVDILETHSNFRQKVAEVRKTRDQ